MESAILHFLFKTARCSSAYQKERSGANTEIKDVLKVVFQPGLLTRLGTFWPPPVHIPFFHHICCAVFHFNRTKRRNRISIPGIFLPTLIVLVLMMLRLGIYVSLYFKDAFEDFTCYSFLSNTDCTCPELFLQYIFSTPNYYILASR